MGARQDVMLWQRGGTYDVKPLNDVLVVQAAGHGGGSLIYANVQMRPPPDVFDDGWPRGYSRAARLRVAERLAVAGRLPAEPDAEASPRVRARTSLGST